MSAETKSQIVMVVEFNRGDRSSFDDTGIMKPDVFIVDVGSTPFIPDSLELPGFNVPFEPTIVTYRRGVDTGVRHGPYLYEAGLEELSVDKPQNYTKTLAGSAAGGDQHDVFGDAEQADIPDDYLEGEEASGDVYFGSRDRVRRVFPPASFGRPTSEWRPR